MDPLEPLIQMYMNTYGMDKGQATAAAQQDAMQQLAIRESIMQPIRQLMAGIVEQRAGQADAISSADRRNAMLPGMRDRWIQMKNRERTPPADAVSGADRRNAMDPETRKRWLEMQARRTPDEPGPMTDREKLNNLADQEIGRLQLAGEIFRDHSRLPPAQYTPTRLPDADPELQKQRVQHYENVTKKVAAGQNVPAHDVAFMNEVNRKMAEKAALGLKPEHRDILFTKLMDKSSGLTDSAPSGVDSSGGISGTFGGQPMGGNW